MKAKTELHAEDFNFWKTSRTSPDEWLEKTKKQIVDLKGEIIGEGFGSDASGRSAFMVAFKCAGDQFKVIWPVLNSADGDQRAARIQAATMLYYYVKSVCLYASIVGARTAFFSHLLLADGRMAAQMAAAELEEFTPKLLLMGKT